jgi:hypothetical protein
MTNPTHHQPPDPTGTTAPLCAAAIPDAQPDPVLSGVLCGNDALPDSRFCLAHQHTDQHTDHCGA